MATENAYVIHLPVYEGPLDLLLELIEQAELDITKVALAHVTDQFLAHVRAYEAYHLEDLSSFLVVAAKLLQIKSEALLPRPPIREPGEEDPGDALARQLIAYKKYKQVAIMLADRVEAGLRTYVRVRPGLLPEPNYEFIDLSIEMLRGIYAEVLRSALSRREIKQTIPSPAVHIRDRIAAILGVIRRSGRTTFRRLLRGARSRVEVVVSFLALLELVKQRRITVTQSGLFDEIEMTKGEAWSEDQSLDFDLEFEE
jgi:segregation and condensation protein A